MRNFKNSSTKAIFLAMTMTVFTSFSFHAQQFKMNNSKSTLEVFGTSSLHDWEIKANQQSGTIKLSSEGELMITSLSVSIESESLKSYKSGMDKNTYKALKTSDYKYITFEMVRVDQIKGLGNSAYQVVVTGKLTIAGVTKTIELPFKMWMANNMVTLEGQKAIKMTDYGIEPPTALLGTIKTGDEITIKFKSILTN